MAKRGRLDGPRRAASTAGINGDEPILIRQHGVKIEFVYFRKIGGELRQLDQQERDSVGACSGDVAASLKHARHAAASNQSPREPETHSRTRASLTPDSPGIRSCAG